MVKDYPDSYPPMRITNKCNHCGGEFVYEYVCSICPKCFIAGHRWSDCGPHCKETVAGRAFAEMFGGKSG